MGHIIQWSLNQFKCLGLIFGALILVLGAILQIITSQLPVKAESFPASSARFGIAGGGELAYQSPAKLAQYMRNIRAIGVERVRFDIDWDAIQYRGPNSYDWSGYDPVVDAAVHVGLKVVAVLTHTPKWARAADCVNVSSRCRPVNPAAFAHFSGVAVQRYAPKGVHAWEIWNEPNLSALWLPAVDARSYTDFLKQASQEIRKNDSQSLILLGGLTHTFTSNGNSSPADYIKTIYANGGGDSFDAVAVHPYTYPFLPGYTGEPTGWKSLKDLHAAMVSNGQPQKKIWITEFGAPTGGPNRQATSGMTRTELGCDHVTEDLQRRMVTEATDFVAKNTWIDAFFWYSYQDKSNDQSSTENHYGLLRADGSLKPSYDALQYAIMHSPY